MMNRINYAVVEDCLKFFLMFAFALVLLASAGLLIGITVSLYQQQPVSTPVVQQQPVAPAKCTAEQAVMWWNNSKDIKAAKSALCGK